MLSTTIPRGDTGRIGEITSLHRWLRPYDAEMLRGRELECARIDAMLAEVRAGQSGSLVLRGEAGIGKSALLDYAAANAAGFQVLRGTGIESESEFPFAAVQQLLWPVRAHLDGVPQQQRTAVEAAFGMGPGAGHDRFLVSLGILSLLSDVAETQPVLCVIDDAQWLDGPSADSLTFVARRLEAEGVLLLFGVRDHETEVLGSAALPELRLTGLDPSAALSLLEDGLVIDPHVRDLLIAGAAGNPLGLRELPRSLSADQLAGRAPLPGLIPTGERLKQVFLSQVRRLPEDTQTMLLLAAAEHTGDLRAVLAAAALVGAGTGALEDAERAGMVTVVDNRVVFRHPLMRSAVYGGATFLKRRAANQSLAAVLARAEDADRRAWQLSAAAVGPDESLASQLEDVGRRALDRGGYAAAATAFARAAELTPDPEPQAARLLEAARACWQAGKPERARGLLDTAAPLASGKELRAGIARLRGSIEFSCGEPIAAYASLLAGAELVAESAPTTAAAILAEAGQIAWVSGNIPRLSEAARRLAGLPEPTDATAVTATLVLGLERLLSGDTEAAAAALLCAAKSAEKANEPSSLGQSASVALFTGDDAGALELFERAVGCARSDGAVNTLPMLLGPLSALQAWTGRYDSATANATEGMRLALDTGQENPAAHHRSVLAWVAAVQGREQDCRAAAAAALSRAIGHRLGPQAAIASWALALLDLGMGRPGEAFDRLNAMIGAGPGEGHQLVKTFAAADLVEVAVRSGRDQQAADVAAMLRAWATNMKASWALALAARCDALLDPSDSDNHFERATALHAQSGRPFDAARTELLYGESLRRRRNRIQARTHLRAAHEAFESLGAAPWADRARAELLATGETARKRDPSTLSQLTPQELQIVRLVGAGGTNREIAAQLFLSARTIDYHLHKVFAKLGISSRTELVRLTVSGEA